VTMRLAAMFCSSATGEFERETLFVLTIGVLLVGASLTIHAFFMYLILKSQIWLKSRRFAQAGGFLLLLPSILLATVFIAIASFIEVTLWASVLTASGKFDGLLDALYFSATTYTTLGTARHVLVAPYRALEPMEAVAGMLASGLNTAVLFAIFASLGRTRSGFDEFFR
jgi:hypothetical protein